MGSKLTEMSREEFVTGVAAISLETLSPASLGALYAHYTELTRWNERLGLIGPGTEHEVMVRHYGEALAALQLIPESARTAVDLGSGAGFPGFVLAAARPGLAMTLVEARERKWSFLVTAARKAALPCHCLNARVANPLPTGLPEHIDLVTVRALKLETDVLSALARRLTPQGSVLVWAGGSDPEVPPELSPHVSLRLAGGDRRRIVQLRLAHAADDPEPARRS